MAQPSHSSAAPPTSVVGRQFCAPRTVVLTLMRNSGSFVVKNATGNDVFRGHRVSFHLRERRVLQDTAGNTLLTMQEKLRTIHSRWRVFRGNSTDDATLLFTVKKSRMLQMQTSLDVFLATNREERACNFKVKESEPGGTFNVHQGNSSVKLAQIKKDGDNFVVTICPNVDQAFVVTLVINLQEISMNNEEVSMNLGGIAMNLDGTATNLDESTQNSEERESRKLDESATNLAESSTNVDAANQNSEESEATNLDESATNVDECSTNANADEINQNSEESEATNLDESAMNVDESSTNENADEINQNSEESEATNLDESATNVDESSTNANADEISRNSEESESTNL